MSDNYPYPHSPDPDDAERPDQSPEEIEATVDDRDVAASLTAIATCALEIGRSPSQSEYTRWRRAQPRGERAQFPSPGYITHYCGTWNGAKERLGLSTCNPNPSKYQDLEPEDIDVEWDHDEDDFEDRYDLDDEDDEDGPGGLAMSAWMIAALLVGGAPP